MIEIRGIGIFDITQMFGIQSVIEESEIKLMIKLEKFTKNSQFERLVEKFTTHITSWGNRNSYNRNFTI